MIAKTNPWKLKKWKKEEETDFNFFSSYSGIVKSRMSLAATDTHRDVEEGPSSESEEKDMKEDMKDLKQRDSAASLASTSSNTSLHIARYV